jgi:serine beta-lactamase-like protein LACTB
LLPAFFRALRRFSASHSTTMALRRITGPGFSGDRVSLFLKREQQGFRIAGLWLGALSMITAFALVLASGLTADDAKISAAEKAQFEDAVSKFMSTTNAPGISAAIVEDGELAWSEGFGLADLENSVPATSRTLYRLGSVSKPLTATAAMQLWERGKIDLDAPVQKYCPAFPVKEWPITTRELLGHLGGIRHYKSESQDDPEIGNTKHFELESDGIKFFANDPLFAKPGTQFHYSTQGYTLVGCAIEGASGEKFVDYIRENVFLPAGMNDTRDDNLLAVIPRRTRYYSKSKSDAVVNADLLDPSYKIPGGGIISSADDMARFEIAIMNDALIKRSTRDIMWTPQKPTDGKPDVYALGWGTGNLDGVSIIGHNGSQQGASTVIILAPEKRAAVVVLINMDEVDAHALGNQLLKLIVAAAPAGKN